MINAVIKERCGSVVSVRTEDYDTSLTKVRQLEFEMLRDFPDLVRNHPIRIILYAGKKYKGMIGLEMIVPVSTIPDCYTPITELPDTMNR